MPHPKETVANVGLRRKYAIKPKHSKAPASKEAKFKVKIEEVHTIIMGLTGKRFARALVIPSTIDGYSVTEIGEGAFSNCSALASVVIPESVREIEFMAFKGCTALASLGLPNGPITIGAGAFKGRKAFVGYYPAEFRKERSDIGQEGPMEEPFDEE